MNSTRNETSENLADARREAEAGEEPDREHDHELEDVRPDVREDPAGEDRGAPHRQRAEAVDQALLQVVREPERGDEAAEDHRLHDDPRHQEVDVVEPRRLDRAAEDVDEQQHEHDRLHRVSRPAGRAGAGCGGGSAWRGRTCPRRAHSDRRSSRPRRSSSAAWPVSSRKTSSSVGVTSDVVDRDARLVEPPHGLGDRAAALAQRHADRAVLAYGGASPRRRSASIARSRSAASPRRTSSRSPPTCPLSSSGVPSAITRPWSMTAMRSPAGRPRPGTGWSGEPSCPRRRGLDQLPEGEAAPRVEAGRRLVEEEHGRPRDQRGGEVEPAAHAAGVRLHEAVAGLREVEGLEQLARALASGAAGPGGRAARPSRGSRGRSGSRRRPRTGRQGRSARAAARHP